MSVRLPDDVHARLTEAAKARHMSVNAALAQAAEQWVTEQAHEHIANAAIDDVFARRGELFARLADS